MTGFVEKSTRERHQTQVEVSVEKSGGLNQDQSFSVNYSEVA